MATSATLAASYDAALLDLDGTIYEGGRPIPGAYDALVKAGLPMLFVTNNASRAPRTVANQLTEMGYNCSPDDVMTSAQAAIEMAKDHIPDGATVLVLGADSFRELARNAGYTVTDTAEDNPAAVLHGHSPDTGWAQLSEAALSIRKGAVYLASNLDTTLPSERGLCVGNGSMVAAIVSATGVEPLSAGKPLPPMFHRGAERIGSTNPLAIGDRLNTDIAGGNNAGYATLMVITGVSGHFDALTATGAQRPTYIGADMSSLLGPIEHTQPGPQAGFTASWSTDAAGTIIIDGGDEDDERLHNPAEAAVAALLTAAELAWADDAATVDSVVGGSTAAESALAAWR
ncbi:HAD-IIA family hydrolase [Corynebacterium sp. TAE3-ERU12]|uniref:HAD-IIA family hydrolase n=1 Tax=Corynebacterium sp. TAE3-ERU12 TaxID=2849491 RepID=UPI001C4721D1|nr:HAD-IIA family hydrolase [Corynebacterium sp. TAE3-ERU12]MBV7295531.1 HAD-IIA family hydrolase [Corynebacterium sp. TAE3-ERU12]